MVWATVSAIPPKTWMPCQLETPFLCVRRTYRIGHHGGEQRPLVIVEVELCNEAADDDHLEDEYYGV